jgi:capsular polysaccharide biosynthesis protein
MELKQLWKIALRWWWVIVIPPLAVGAYTLATYRAPGPSYSMVLRYTAGQPTTLSGDPAFARNYYDWLTSEYIVGALKDWVRTGQFAGLVSEALKARGVNIEAGTVAAAITASDNARSILIVYLGSTDQAQLQAIGETLTVILQTRNAEIFPPLNGQPATVTPLDTPAIGQAPPSLRASLDVPLRLGLGLAVGLALALVAHYIDPTVREKGELEQMGLKVLGEIPSEGARHKARLARMIESPPGVTDDPA